MSELISGKEALIALANGEEVEYWCETDPSIQRRWTLIKNHNEYKLSYFIEDKPRFEFRLKPRTITINGIEVPKPFEPKEGEKFYTIVSDRKTGYDFYNYFDNVYCDTLILNSGAWRTEEEIKQVVAALREVFK